MKAITCWNLTVITMLLAILGVLAGFDQVRAHERKGFAVPLIEPIKYPQLVRLIGTLHAPGDKEKAVGMNTLKLFVDKKEWIFKIKKAVDLTGDMTELDILENIWPPQLTLRGPANLIDPLQQPDVAGKRFVIQGYLYISDRILEVDSVRDVGEKKEKKK